jgi:uncharacterized protein (DUF1697 family)
MADLKIIFEELGCINIQTYIQSGNVSYKTSETNISQIIRTSIQQKFGFEVPVQVFNSDRIRLIVSANPFLKDRTADVRFLHVTFLDSIPNKQLVELLEETRFKNEEFRIIENIVYLFCPNGYGKAKLNNNLLERKLKVSATTRNWKTALKIASMTH